MNGISLLLAFCTFLKWLDDNMEKNLDIELFRLFRTHLFTAVVDDIMDQMQQINQFLPPTSMSAVDTFKTYGIM